jgi:hypothetical protein
LRLAFGHWRLTRWSNPTTGTRFALLCITASLDEGIALHPDQGGPMTIGNALAFIERGLRDSALRNRLNSVANSSELQHVLEAEKLAFSAHDLDEAFKHRLIQCQEEEEADQIKEFKLWWSLLSRNLESSACGNHCSGCCS